MHLLTPQPLKVAYSMLAILLGKETWMAVNMVTKCSLGGDSHVKKAFVPKVAYVRKEFGPRSGKI